MTLFTYDKTATKIIARIYCSLKHLKIKNNVKKLKLNSYTIVNKSLQITAISDILPKSECRGGVFFKIPQMSLFTTRVKLKCYLIQNTFFSGLN